MTPEVAAKVLATYESLGSKGMLDGAKGTQILVSWLTARGGKLDRYGNYLFRDGAERWHFKEQVVRREKKSQYGWHGVSSMPLIEAGYNLIEAAAKTLDRKDVLEHIVAQRARRGATKVKRASKASEEESRRQAMIWASKIFAQKHPDAYAASAEETGAARDKIIAKYRSEVESLTTMALEKIKRGEKVNDGEIVSSDSPPVGVFFGTLFGYEWVESEGGVDYSIVFEPRAEGVVDVQIGKSSEFGMRVSATSMRVSMSPRGLHDKGDGFLSGVIGREKGGRMAAKVFMVVSHTPRSGAGSRLLTIWCRMMEGYGIRQWIAEAVGDQGQAAIEAWARRGVVKIVTRHGSNILVECGPTEKRKEEWSLT